MVILNITRYWFFNGVALYILASGDLQCRLTTNLGPFSVANATDKLILNCSNVGSNDSTYTEWKKSGSMLSDSSSILSRNNITRRDAGKYECTLVKGNQRSKGCVVFVKVNSSPLVSLSAEITDKKMNLTCDVTGYPKPEILWYKNGTKVVSSKRNYLKIHHITVNRQRYQSSLTKTYPDKTDNGKYTCKAKNKYREDNATKSFICIGCSPLVSLSAEITDEKVSLTCDVTGYPKPEILWYKNGTKVVSSKRNYLKIHHITVNRQRYQSSLTKTYPDKTDNGKYTCKAKNKYGEDNATKSFICIGYDLKCPKFAHPGKKIVHFQVGMSVTMLCTVYYPQRLPLDVFDVLPLNRGKNHKYSSAKNCSTVVMNYTIFNATKNDTGEYNCTYNRLNKPDCYLPIVKTFILHVEPQTTASSRTKKNIYIAVAVSVSGALIGLVLVLLIYVRKKKLESQRFYDSLPELRWDVFVSYSSKDFLWVKNLCDILEAPPFNLVVCLHQRDWELGRAVIDNMADSVYCSQKTLIIMSKNYLESSYCMQELQIAMHSEMCRSFSKETIVLIKIDDVSLKKLPRALRQKSYLDFSNNEQRKHFKTKLLKALPSKSSVTETNTIEQMFRNTYNESDVSGDLQLSDVTSDMLT